MKKTTNTCFSLLFAMILLGCADTREKASGGAAGDDPPEIEIQFSNQSQFKLHHIFLHQPEQNYKETTSLISSFLEIGQVFSYKTGTGDYRVTVTRLKNQDGRLLAFTTQYPLEITDSVLLEYFDNQFRLHSLSAIEDPSADSE